MLQEGPLPCFMHDSVVKKVFGQLPSEEFSEAERQIREGFRRFGLLEVKTIFFIQEQLIV